MPYTLITVTRGGAVHHARGFETLRMCQEARSIALYGCTIAEKEEREMEAREAEKERQRRIHTAFMAAWAEKHPPREATPDEAERIRSLVLEWKVPVAVHYDPVRPFYVWGATFWARVGSAVLGSDGLVHELPVIDGRTIAGPLAAPDWAEQSGDIKHAVCVIEMPDAPGAELAA